MSAQSIAEVDRVLQAAFGSSSLHSGLAPSRSRVKLMADGHPEMWVTIYGTYMDFAYIGAEDPAYLLNDALVSLSHPRIIDWCPGRLACVEYDHASALVLSDVIDVLADRLFGLRQCSLVGTVETWASA